MPYKTEKLKLNDVFLKRSAKLLPCQKEMMLWWYERGLSIRAITRMFHCSRRLVQFTLFPDRHKKNLSQRQDRGGSKIYYVKDKQTKAIRIHRIYKHKLLKNNAK